MPVIPLPDEPSFEQLRKQAKDLRRAVLAGDPRHHLWRQLPSVPLRPPCRYPPAALSTGGGLFVPKPSRGADCQPAAGLSRARPSFSIR